MTPIQPAGISSYLSWKDKKLYLQTEFALRPKPRITTTVSSEGEVLYKAEQIWEGGLKREDDKRKVEALTKKQHGKVKRLIQTKAEQILGERIKKPLPKFWEQVSKMEGIENIFAFDQEGKLLYQETEEGLSEKISKGIISTIQLSKFLSQISKLKDLNKGNITTEEFKLILFRRRENYFAVKLSPNRNLERAMSKIEKILT